MRGKLVTVFGGSGFLGSYLIPKLRAQGALVRVVTRDTDTSLALKTAGPVGQVELVAANLSKDEELERVIGDSDYVVNLIGILNETRRNSFKRIHTDLPKRIASIAAKHGVQRFVHISAIGADRDSPSKYASSKGQGEVEVLKAFPSATILRPSVIFGPEDDFFNKFAAMAQYSPFLPLLGGGKTKMQPVYVGDVAEVILHALAGGMEGKTYELGGPQAYTFRELMALILKEIRRRRWFLYLPYPVASLMGAFLWILPDPPITRDQVKLAKKDNIVAEDALGFKDLRMEPTAVEAVLPSYLDRYRFHG